MRPAALPAQNSGRYDPRHSAHARNKISANNRFCECGQLLLPLKIQVAAVLVTLRMRGIKISANYRFCECGQLLLPLKIQVATVLVTLRMRGMKISENNRFCVLSFGPRVLLTIFGEINNILVGLLHKGNKDTGS
jgi:hypothetical protein